MAAILVTPMSRKKVGLVQREVKIAQTGLRLKETYFENERLARLGVEVMSFSHLLRRTTIRALSLPERVHFYMLMFVTGGRGEHSVDCVTSAVSAGSLVLIRPGQVQRWNLRTRYAAELVLFDPIALQPAETSVPGFGGLDACPDCMRVPRACVGALLSDLTALKAEVRRFDNSELAAALIRHMLLVLLMRVARWSQGQVKRRGGEPLSRDPHRLFLQKLETDFRKSHRVYHYAQRLGYSVSTLNRACAVAEGRSTKSIIDRRIALEAQRLLVHSSASYAEISHHLGFSEATNFVKFFCRVVGRKPAALRR